MSFLLRFPPEAYSLTLRLRRWTKDADPTAGMVEYGLGGTAYAKARKLAEKENQARAWQEQNAPAIFTGSSPIPDVDENHSSPDIAAEKKLIWPSKRKPKGANR